MSRPIVRHVSVPGWTGDAQLFFNTGNYMMDQRAFFRKWMRDVADCQKGNGLVYNVNPTGGKKSGLIEWISMEGSAGWGDAMVTIPYYFWKRYGDDCLIRENWQARKSALHILAAEWVKETSFPFFHQSEANMTNILWPVGDILVNGRSRTTVRHHKKCYCCQW